MKIQKITMWYALDDIPIKWTKNLSINFKSSKSSELNFGRPKR